VCQFAQLRIFGLLTNNGILHDGVAKVIHPCRDGEDAAQPLVHTFIGRAFIGRGLLGLRMRTVRTGQ
jgi:hypothetical protein